MSGPPKKISLIKQVLQLKRLGVSNRGISGRLPINKETVNGYIKLITTNNWDLEELSLPYYILYSDKCETSF